MFISFHFDIPSIHLCDCCDLYCCDGRSGACIWQLLLQMFLASSRVNKMRKQWKAITSPASRSFRGLTRCTFQPSGAAWPRVALPLSFLNLEMSPASHSTHSRLWIQRLCMALLPRDVAEMGFNCFNKHSQSPLWRLWALTPRARMYLTPSPHLASDASDVSGTPSDHLWPPAPSAAALQGLHGCRGSWLYLTLTSLHSEKPLLKIKTNSKQRAPPAPAKVCHSACGWAIDCFSLFQLLSGGSTLCIFVHPFARPRWPT